MYHVWNIYQHLPHKPPSFVGKYTSTMEHLGIGTMGYHGIELENIWKKTMNIRVIVGDEKNIETLWIIVG